MRKPEKNPTAGFFEDKGFYIILFLCVAAIGISGYVLFFTPKSPSTELLDTAIYEPTIVPSDYAPVVGDEGDIPLDPSTEKETVKQEDAPSETKEEQPQNDAKTTAKTSTPVFVQPVSGKLVVPFSADELVYQPTFADWRVHSGADYAANIGDRVYAITDGTVADVYTDPLKGPCVRLKHADGVETLYVGLGDKLKVKAGQTVKSGDVIGVVDNTNQTESAQDPHIHVEAFQNEKPIDPETLLNSNTEKAE